MIEVVLTDLLLAVSQALADAGRPVERIVRSPGPPPADCEMLSAWPSVKLIQSSKPGQRIMRLSADVSVQLLRCVVQPSDGIPSEEVFDTDGAAYAFDMDVLARALAQFSHPSCTRYTFSGVSADQLTTLSSMTGRVELELAG